MLKTMCSVTVIAGVIVAAPLPFGGGGAAQARACKDTYIRSWGKRSRTMFGARVSARYAWKRASRAINGTRYDTWWPSEAKSMRCYTDRRGRKRCLAGAYPCTIF